MAENSKDLGLSLMNSLSCLMTSFSCKICFEVLDDPVQCQNNEHYFCRKCMTKHLENSETCPLCMDQLTLETLRPSSRVVANFVPELKKARCRHVSRGCTENVEVKDVLLHEQRCDYAPVVCSNEGCKETVNRCDQESHETEECKFRKITCESCDEELVYVDYERHQCTLRIEMDDVKLQLKEIKDALDKVVLAQRKMQEQLEAHDQSIKDSLRRTSPTAFQREATVASRQIFIFGGNSSEAFKSIEVFNWSTKTWTLIRNCLFLGRRWSYSFIYGKIIMICGGETTEKIEYLNPSESRCTAAVASVSLSSNARYNGVLYKDRILTFWKDVVETSLQPPGEPRTLLPVEHGCQYCFAGVHLFGDNVYIVGGQQSKIEKYDVDKNEMEILPSLPYKVSGMATVAYKDNIIIIGGCYEEESLNDVVMFNVTTHEYKKLPSMLEKRSFCTAVIMGDVIVVMGGRNQTDLSTVEYYVIGESSWQELPAMHLARFGATACVYTE